jgi:hypothetical protein
MSNGISCPERGAAPSWGAADSIIKRVDPGSAAHRYTLRSIPGTQNLSSINRRGKLQVAEDRGEHHQGETDPGKQQDAFERFVRRLRFAGGAG